MANWCNNVVVFEGSPEAIEQIQQLFKSMAEMQEKENCGQLPDFVSDEKGGYFFLYDNYQDYDDTVTFRYDTKWKPNTEVVKKIAERYNVNFTQDYEELGCLVYGRVTFSDRLLTDIYLEDEDFEKYLFDEETDTYHFQRTEYACEWDILEILLEEKIKQFNNIKNQKNETIRKTNSTHTA